MKFSYPWSFVIPGAIFDIQLGFVPQPNLPYCTYTYRNFKVFGKNRLLTLNIEH